MNDSKLNPLGNLYDNVIEMLQNVTIKFNYLAEKYETLETEQNADAYLDAVLRRDSFESYDDYTYKEVFDAGITDKDTLNEIMAGNISLILDKYKPLVLENRRKNIIYDYEEKNNYYRMLNGFPDIEEKPFTYLYLDRIVDEDGYIDELLTTEGIKIKNTFDEDINVAIHLIQDHYNRIENEKGDNIINRIESSGFLKKLIEKYPNRKYLKYIGKNRIPIETSRRAKNFQIIQLKQRNMKNNFYNSFTNIYEQCRTYFISTIYIPIFKEFIEEYNNFIAMAIMVMAIQQTVANQMKLGIRREFFDIYAVRLLYQVYNIPYNLYLDEMTQQRIVQGLNLFIQNKATNKVLYDIATALGFGDNFSIYKYYLSKQQKYDRYGVPIFLEKDKFNEITGEVEKVPDYEQMYNVYFHRDELRNPKFAQSFNDLSNDLEYDSVVDGDSYWWKDSNVYDRIWKTEYNFVESKYLGTTISYRMTDLLFENVLLFKMMMEKNEEIKNLRITLPKITGEEQIPLLDVFILMICLTACKHHLTGEILTLPTDILSVLDYTEKVEHGLNTNPHLIEFANQIEEGSIHTVDTFSFDFNYLTSSLGVDEINSLKHKLGDDAFFELKRYLAVLDINSDSSDEDKIDAINSIYKNINNFYHFLNFHLSKTNDYDTYKKLKQLYHAAFYSREMYDLFKINTGSDKRPAFNYFEYLYYKNTVLYESVFDFNPLDQYYTYLKELKEQSEDEDIVYTYEEFISDVDSGKINLHYDILRDSIIDEKDIRDEKIYFYMNHIISRLEIILDNLSFVNLMGDSSTPVEELLMKLIKFFKSHTVEFINMDTIYICDLKPESMIRYFDVIHEANKTNLVKDFIKFPFADTVELFLEILANGGSVKLVDRIIYEVWGWIDSNLKLRDLLEELKKTNELPQNYVLFDAFHYIGALLYKKDRPLITDKVPGEYFDEIIYDIWAWLDDQTIDFKDKIENIRKLLLAKDYEVFYDVFHSITNDFLIRDRALLIDKIPKQFFEEIAQEIWAYLYDEGVNLKDIILIDSNSVNKDKEVLFDNVEYESEVAPFSDIHFKEQIVKLWYDDNE